MQIQVDPAMQALLDSLPTRTVPFTLVSLPIPNTQPPQVQEMVVCAKHKNPVCAECQTNFTPLNYMQQFMRNAPPEAVPPPPNVQPPPQRAEAIKAAKDRGNVSLIAEKEHTLCVHLLTAAERFQGGQPCPGYPGVLEIRRHGAFAATMGACGHVARGDCDCPVQSLGCVPRGSRMVSVPLCLDLELTVRANALADADAVIALKRQWTKGHFR
jgi:translocation protein SEC72